MLPKRLMPLLLSAAVCFTGVLGPAVPTPAAYAEESRTTVNTDEMSAAQMKEDLEYLVRILKNVHPSTIEGFSDKQKAIIQESFEKVTQPLDKKDFYFIANRITASMNDGHTNLGLSINTMNILYVQLRWLNDSIVVASDSGNLKKGDKILKIGGKTEGELYRAIDTLVPAENPYWKKYRGESCLIMEPYLTHLGLVSKDGTVELAVERDGIVFTENLAFQRLAPSSALGTQPQETWVGWDIEEENSLAVFYLHRCQYDQYYIEKVNEFFNVVKEKQIRNIAIDLRKNTGGSIAVITEFTKRIDNDSFMYFDIWDRVSEEIRSQSNNYKNTVDGYYNESRTQIRNHKAPEDQLYKGNLFILTSFRTFSSASLITLLFKDNNLATIIGEPTGNATTRYGEGLDFKLPNSKFSVQVAHKLFGRPNTDAAWEDSIYPHIAVYTTREDILYGIDPQLERLRKECK